MGVEHFLICENCKEFIRVGKLKLSKNNIYPFPIEGKIIDKKEIIEQLTIINDEIEKRVSYDWIIELLPFLTTFLKEHSNHIFKIKDDVTDHYWDPEFVNYTQWKEFYSPNTSELFLPRNLIDDLKIYKWEDVIEYLKKSKNLSI